MVVHRNKTGTRKLVDSFQAKMRSCYSIDIPISIAKLRKLRFILTMHIFSQEIERHFLCAQTNSSTNLKTYFLIVLSVIIYHLMIPKF